MKETCKQGPQTKKKRQNSDTTTKGRRRIRQGQTIRSCVYGCMHDCPYTVPLTKKMIAANGYDEWGIY
jgi:hypothetical protein